MSPNTAAQPTDETLADLGIARDDWEFCRARLEEVSRTFSKPIGMLPGTLSIAATCGYLLCRVADTIEDHAELGFADKRDLFDQFLAVLEEGAPPEAFIEAFDDVPGEGPYFDLAGGLDRVMAVFWRLPDAVVETSIRWIGEMSRGMCLYTRRAADTGELATVETLRDLERYCYFVAGTVGHMMTGLFLHHIDEVGDVDPARERTMRETAEQFGLGLQLVNIVKDQTDDLDRGWCYIPRTAAAREGLAPDELYDEANREAAHRVVEPIIERAEDHLDDALEFTLAIPADQKELRVACLLPLWMAVRTLSHARGNDAMFVEGAPVKISREEVGAIIGECAEFATEDGYLRERYDALWDNPVS